MMVWRDKTMRPIKARLTTFPSSDVNKSSNKTKRTAEKLSHAPNHLFYAHSYRNASCCKFRCMRYDVALTQHNRPSVLQVKSISKKHHCSIRPITGAFLFSKNHFRSIFSSHRFVLIKSNKLWWIFITCFRDLENSTVATQQFQD